MEEWKEYRLGDIISISGGFAYKGELIGSGDNYLLSMGCVSFSENFLDKGARQYAGESPDRFYAYPGDIVLATRQQSDNLPILGMPAIIPSKYEGHKMIVGANLYRVDIKDKSFNNRFLYWLLKTPSYVNHIRSCQSGTTVRMITKANIEDYIFYAPDKTTRDHISDFIWALDDKIEVNRKINENLEQQAQALFKSWFVDFEPFKNGEFVESELGMIPKGWRVKEAQDAFEINIGKTPPRKESEWFTESKEDNVWVSIADMGSCGMFVSESSEYLTNEAINRFNILMVDEGSVLLSFKLTVGRVAIADTRLTTNEAIARFQLPQSYYREFLYLYLKQYKYGNLGSTSSIATAVNSKTIKGMKLITPPEEVISCFSKPTKPLFDKIKVLSQESRHLASLRDTLLPKLMSGELKVCDIVL